MKHVYYGSASAPDCLNCGAEAGTLHYANCPCNTGDYDGDEPWDESEDEEPNELYAALSDLPALTED